MENPYVNFKQQLSNLLLKPVPSQHNRIVNRIFFNINSSTRFINKKTSSRGNLADVNPQNVYDVILNQKGEFSFEGKKPKLQFDEGFIKKNIKIAVKIFHDLGKKNKSVYHGELYVNEIMNIFFRLTQYINGSIVPLMDLLNKDFVSSVGYDSSRDKDIYVNILQVKENMSFIFTLLDAKNIELPAPYLKNLEAFEKTDDLYQKLLELENSFDHSTKL